MTVDADKKPASGSGPKAASKRQRLSCKECVKKKRKCDRIKPCSACCFQGVPSRCEYAGNFEGLSQAEEIRRLRRKLATLEAQSQSKDPSETKLVESSSPGTIKGKSSPPSSSEPPPLQRPSQERLSQALALTGLSENRISLAPSMQTAIVSKFINNVCPPEISGHHQWIWPVAQASHDSIMLWRALAATSYADQALTTRDHAMFMEGQYQYTYAVNQLRNHLRNPGKTKTFDTKLLYTMMVLELYETISFRDTRTWSMHIDGAEAFLQDVDLGPQVDIPQAVFDMMRLIDITIKFSRREKTYFLKDKWKQASFNITGERSPVAKLVDILEMGTALMAKVDGAQSLYLQASEAMREVMQKYLWDEVDRMDNLVTEFIDELEFADWKNHGVAANRSPVAEKTHIDELSICIGLSFRLVLSRIDTRPWKPTEQVYLHIATKLTKLIARLSKERSDTTSGIVLLFTIRGAFYTFPDGHPGREIVRQLTQNIAEKFRIGIGNGIIDLFSLAKWTSAGSAVGSEPVSPQSSVGVTVQ